LLGVSEFRGTCHGIAIIEVTPDLKVASVFVEWVVAEVHQAGDLDGDLDVEGDPLRSRDSQPSHLIENVVLLELLQPVDL